MEEEPRCPEIQTRELYETIFFFRIMNWEAEFCSQCGTEVQAVVGSVWWPRPVDRNGERGIDKKETWFHR